MDRADFLIVGGGMAGASAAYFLAEYGTAIVLERETQPGYHSTGRSAALYTDTYGAAPARALTVASRAFFDAPPDGFSQHPLLTPRGTITFAPEDQVARFDGFLAEAAGINPDVVEIAVDEALERCPILRRDHVVRAMIEPHSMDMDVHAIHQGFLRGLRARGGRVVTDAEVLGLSRIDGVWQAETRAGRFAAPLVFNAGGAWADTVAGLAGVAPIGLVPKRRTVLTFDPPPGDVVDGWASIIDVAETFYVKPDAGRLLGTPADETPVLPQDVQPEEIDVALAVERIRQATIVDIRRIEHRWAGLRSFVSDRLPVVGPAAEDESFIWLAGQGGAGIMTAPALGQLVTAAALGLDVPPDLAARGVGFATFGQGRLAGPAGQLTPATGSAPPPRR